MLRKLRAFLKSYRAAGGASPLVVLVLLLCASMLSLTMLFSGSGNISDNLLSSIPLEFAFKRIHYFSQNYNPYKTNGLGHPQGISDGVNLRRAMMASQEDSTAERLQYPHHMTNIAKEERFLEYFLSRLDELARDPAVKYASYNLQYFLNMKGCGGKGSTAASGNFPVIGINGIDFFAHNNIPFIEVEEDSFSDDAAYVNDRLYIRGKDGKMRPIEIGDQIEVASMGGLMKYKTYTVKGIYHNVLKFDYSYGEDGAYLSVFPAMCVSNASLRQIHPMEFVVNDIRLEMPYVHSIVFDIKSPADYDYFYQKLNDFSEEMDAYAQEIYLWGTVDIRIQTPTYLKMAGTVTQTVNYYSLVMWIIDAMLLILSGSLVWYLLLGKRREMFLLHSLGMSKIRIALRYLAYFLLPVLLTALVGVAPGLLLNRLLCTRIASRIFSTQNALLSFSSSGNHIMDAAGESIRTFTVKGTDILLAFCFTVLVTAVVSGIIVFFGTLLQLRGSIRARIRSREL